MNIFDKHLIRFLIASLRYFDLPIRPAVTDILACTKAFRFARPVKK